MYALLGIDAVLRITAAVLFLFVAVPALARRRPEGLDRLQWFWWCAAGGMVALTIAGQLLTLLKVFSAVTLLVLIAVLIVTVRAARSGRRPSVLLRDWYRGLILVALHTLEGRVNVRRRIRRAWRRGRRSLLAVDPQSRRQVLAWTALIVVAAALRFYRPFKTANLGFSDTFVHLYLVRLLEQGQQVDPAWGPYPRGMHFLLMAIRELTNIDAILLMNFFGPVAGVLMTLAAADAARRLTRNAAAGLIAGALFATMIGGAQQYFLLGGSVATDRVGDAEAFVRLRYEEVPRSYGEFDVLATTFQRQTATLPQELALVFLFPAAMFLLTWLQRTRERPAGIEEQAARIRESRWHLSGYLLCTAVIAATHPGVAVPLVLLSAVTVVVARASLKEIVVAMLAGAAGIVLGSTWMLAYFVYPPGGRADVRAANDTASTIAYYFPFMRTAEDARIVTFVAVTPFLVACVALAILMLLAGIAVRRTSRVAFVWPSLAVLLFTCTHLASRYRFPEIVEVRRNAAWLAMAMAILLGVAAAELLRTRVTKAVAVALAVLWLWRVPIVNANDRMLEYSGYSSTAWAVLQIERDLEPFTWTLVTYGQEFPLVLGKGFHLAAVDFLDRYPPADPTLKIPTPYVFIAVEKTPHPFEVNTWAARFSRADIQRRLQTWCFLYQRTHNDMSIFRDDENVRVYVIRRNLQARIP